MGRLNFVSDLFESLFIEALVLDCSLIDQCCRKWHLLPFCAQMVTTVCTVRDQFNPQGCC